MAVARYDAVADFYANGFDSTNDSVSLALLELLGPVAGLHVLDVACGHGRVTRELARRGADVAGIDISGNLIRKAREIEQREPLGISFVQADVAAPGSLGSREFDLVACSFGLSDIDDLDGAAQEALARRCAARSEPATGCYRPTWARSGGTTCGWSRSSSRFRRRTGTRLTMLTASPSTSRPGPSRSSRANCLTCPMTSARS